jgi:hypothetical protein
VIPWLASYAEREREREREIERRERERERESERESFISFLQVVASKRLYHRCEV